MTATRLRDAVRRLVLATHPEPPLEAERGDLVVPTDTAEDVDELAQIGDCDRAVAAEQQRDPPHRCAVVFQRGIVADEENEAGRVR